MDRSQITTSQRALREAVRLAGSQAELARALQIERATVSRWMTHVIAPLPSTAAQIERYTAGKVRVEQIRPDLRWHRVPDEDWPHPDGRPLKEVVR